MQLFILDEILCHGDSFNCKKNSPPCLPTSWVCDGDEDCADGSDEGQGLCSELESISLPHVQGHYLKYAFLGNLTCGIRRFDCGNSDPKCITQAQVCNEYPDCSDGSDEASQLCG